MAMRMRTRNPGKSDGAGIGADPRRGAGVGQALALLPVRQDVKARVAEAAANEPFESDVRAQAAADRRAAPDRVRRLPLRLGHDRQVVVRDDPRLAEALLDGDALLSKVGAVHHDSSDA